MPVKNLGSLSSGYTNPDERAWETVVFQAGKPVLDKELVLSSDIDTGAAQETLKRLMPSGWISDDFLSTSSPTTGLYNNLGAVPNTVEMPKSLAHVNGWLVKVEYTNAGSTANRIDFGAGPTNANSTRTDVVILEVWRRLISTSSDDGKSPTRKIWRNGNVKINAANEAVLNFADDIKDANTSTETTKRVQIQYRLRVIKGVDIATYPYGMGDPLVVATTVPATSAALAVDGNAYTGANSQYVNQSSNGDAGLWRAGDGNPTNGLGTVDGYMYAIPVFAACRRNSQPFNKTTNQNGGAASPTASDRPDGLWSNVIAPTDVVDLRFGVTPGGWDSQEVLNKNLNLLLDNALRQEVAITGTDAAPLTRGSAVFRANEIGGTATAGAGPLIGTWDTVRRRFSDRSIYETVVVTRPVVDFWNTAAGRTVTIDPGTNFAPFPHAAITNPSWREITPPEAMILDVVSIFWAGTTSGRQYVDGMQYVQSITGLAARGKGPITINFTAALTSSGLYNETLYVQLLIAYPRDCGLTHTPVATFSGSMDIANLTTTSPTAFGAWNSRGINSTHREVVIDYTTSGITFSFYTGNTPGKVYRLPDRAQSIISVGSTPAQTGSATLDTEVSGRVVTLTTQPNANSLVQISYVAIRAVPTVSNAKLTVMFRSAAPATISKTVAGTTLTVVPKLISEKLLTITAGSASQGEAYPFPQAYVQTGGVYPGSVTALVSAAEYSGEASMTGSTTISVADFSADTGMLMLPTYIPMAANAESFSFARNGHTDVEDRTYFPAASSTYLPNAYGQSLSNASRHKNVLPILAELPQDTTFGFKGQLILVLLVRYAALDAVNAVFFKSDLNTNSTAASAIRVKGNLLNKRT